MKTLQNLIGGSWEDSRGDALPRCGQPGDRGGHRPLPRRLAARTSPGRGRGRDGRSPAWAALPVAERVDPISAWADTIAEHAEELAELECREMGKPVALGRAFIEGAALGSRPRRPRPWTTRSRRPSPARTAARTTILRSPLGATAVIVPWNFPVPMVLGALGPLLAAGNTVVRQALGALADVGGAAAGAAWTCRPAW